MLKTFDTFIFFYKLIIIKLVAVQNSFILELNYFCHLENFMC